MGYVYANGEGCWIGTIFDLKPTGSLNDRLIEEDIFRQIKNIYVHDGNKWVFKDTARTFEEARSDVDTMYVAQTINSQLADMANKAIIPSNIHILSESILGFNNFPTYIASTLNGSVLSPNGSYGGSHIGTQLAEMSDEIYINMNSENSFLYSNDMTQTAWSKDSDITATQETFKDGTVWNKVVKSTGSANTSIYQYPITMPSNATGVFMSVEVYVPVGTTPAQIEQLNFLCLNVTRSVSVGNSFANLVPGKRYKLTHWVDLSGISTWQSGDQIRFRFQQNPSATVPWSANTAYFRNAEISFTAPSGYQNYIPTGSTVASAGASTLTKVEKNYYTYRDIDVVVQSSSRNEAEAGVDTYSHYRAFDKLIDQCKRMGQTIVVGNCPPRTLNGTDWDTTDPYDLNNYHNQFKRLIAKWNTGVDMWQYFKDLTTSGSYTVGQLMNYPSSTVHQSETGSSLIAEKYKKEVLSGRKSLNNADPELRNTVKYYKSGTNTGSWLIKAQNNGLENRLLGGIPVAWVSSTQNDTIVFSNITCEQLHVITMTSSGYGTFDVIIDEGTQKQVTVSFDTNVSSGNQTQNARFIADYLDSGTHTVKIKVTSSGKTVKIFGLVAI